MPSNSLQKQAVRNAVQMNVPRVCYCDKSLVNETERVVIVYRHKEEDISGDLVFTGTGNVRLDFSFKSLQQRILNAFSDATVRSVE